MSESDAAGPLALEASGEVTGVEVSRWRGALVEALNRGQAARVDLTEAAGIGLPGFQLLLAAERSFRSRGVAFEVCDPRELRASLGARIGAARTGSA